MTTTLTSPRSKARCSPRLPAAGDLAAHRAVRIAALGKKGRVSELMADARHAAAEQRKAFGQAVNGLKDRVSEALEARKAELERDALSRGSPPRRPTSRCPFGSAPLQDGRIHPVSQVFDEMRRDLRRHGFRRRRRARTSRPTTSTSPSSTSRPSIRRGRSTTRSTCSRRADGTRMVLRTHTSPVQIRTMLAQKPPIRIIAPGRVYRIDSDATHTPMFHQIEGLVIDETTHLGHLKWCLEEFCKAFFEVDEVRMRFRASHFPFTEPSMEVDIDAAAIGKPGQWLEILGCGMVHPNVIRNCGLDPDKYQGFAFGMGLDRIAMLKYGIPDLRDMFCGRPALAAALRLRALDVPTLAGGLSG